MNVTTCVPIFRMFDEAKAREFYCDYLGFSVTFEHRFDDGMPLYLGLRLDECELHLSEHHGDATPGSATRIQVEGLDAFHTLIGSRGYAYSQPGIDEMPWGERQVRVTDPFGNRISFWEEGGGR